MPNVAGNLGVHAVNLLATTLNDPVKADVILERIGANDVIVVRIGNTNRDTRCLVDTAGNGLEAYGNLDILRGDRLKDGERETVVSSIGTRLLDHAVAGRGRVANNDPFAGGALARPRESEAGRSG